MARKKGAGGSGRQSKSKPEFRSQVEDEIVDQLLYRFVALVKKGLELMLDNPSELTSKEFRQNPGLVHRAEDIAGLVCQTTIRKLHPEENPYTFVISGTGAGLLVNLSVSASTTWLRVRSAPVTITLAGPGGQSAVVV